MEYSYIYIITDGENYKVGVSVNPKKRLKSLQTGSAKKLKLLETFKVPRNKVYKLEKQCHAKLQSSYLKRGEWFSRASAFGVRVVVDEICEKDLIED